MRAAFSSYYFFSCAILALSGSTTGGELGTEER